MLTLNHSTAAILERLLASGDSVSVEELTDALGCTAQLLRYHVSSLDAALRLAGLGSAEMRDANVVCRLTNREELVVQLGERGYAGYVFSRSERRSIALLSIGLVSRPTTIRWMCDKFDVSRNTVLADVAALREYLSGHGLELESAGRRGYVALGDECELRCLLVEALWNSDSGFVRHVAMRMIDEELLTVIREGAKGGSVDGPRDQGELDARLRGIVADAERGIPGKLTYSAVDKVVLYLKVVSLRNLLGGACSSMGRPSGVVLDLQGTAEYSAARLLVDGAVGLGLPVRDCEDTYLAAVLLSSCVYALDRLGEREERAVVSVVEMLVDAFERQACVRFSDAEGLVRRLLPHARAMLYRLSYRIAFRSEIASIVTGHYRALFDLTRLACDCVGDEMGLTFSDEEVACVSVYFGSWICRDESVEGLGLRRILIVCGSGMGTSLLIRQQLQELLGSGFCYELRNRREVEGVDPSDYDLIISTADIPGLPEGTVRVSALLTKRQSETILDSVFRGGRGDASPTSDVISIVERHAHIDDALALMRDLRALFDGTPASDEGRPIGLLEALTARRIQFESLPCTSEEAIRLGCGPLVRDGLVTEQYAQKIIDLIDELGLYSELREGILVAHAEPGPETLRVGISLTIFSHPVSFERWGRDYRVIFTLAAVDHERHFPVMTDLMTLLSSEEVCEALRSWPADAPEALYLYLTTCLSPKSKRSGFK